LMTKSQDFNLKYGTAAARGQQANEEGREYEDRRESTEGQLSLTNQIGISGSPTK
jgi:hypothetical protein